MKKRIYLKAAYVFMLITFLSAAVSCKQAHPGPLFPFDDGSDNFGKYGVIDSTGNIIIKPQYSSMGFYSEGLMFADLPKKEFINMSQGELRVEARYKGLSSYEDCLDKKGFINTSGKFIISLDRYSWTWWGTKFSDDLSIIGQNGYYGYIDKRGKFVIQPKYKEAKNFSDGVAFAAIEVAVVDSSHSPTIYGVIDKKGEWVIEPQFRPYTAVSKFENGLAPVSQIVKPFDYEAYSGDTETGVDGTKYIIKPMQGFIDKTGKLVTSIDKKYYIRVDTYNEGLIVFQHSDRRTGVRAYDQYPFGYMDTKGRIVINLIPGTQAMDSADLFQKAKFSEGLAAIKIGGAWGYIDQKGEFVIKPQFKDAYPFRFGLAKVRVSNIKGDCYINKGGEIIFPKDSK